MRVQANIKELVAKVKADKDKKAIRVQELTDFLTKNEGMYFEMDAPLLSKAFNLSMEETLKIIRSQNK